MSPTKLSKPRKRRKFTPEFIAEAVRLALTPGKTITEVARELDLTVTCLHDWVRQAGIDGKRDPQGALTTDERAELTRLRRELRTVEQERDFQKKRQRISRRASREVRRHRRAGGRLCRGVHVPRAWRCPVRVLRMECRETVEEDDA